MEFDWGDERDGFPADKLDRAKYAQFLTDYLSSKKDESYVMNLNAEWGAGKTYFIKRWHHEIKDNYPSTYIDAWKNDFSEEPLLTVISEIFLALESYINKYPNTKVLKYRKGAIEKSGQFLKSATKEILKHQFKKYAGEDAFDIISPGIEGISGNITKGLIDSHRDKQRLIDEFKSEIKDWVNNLISESNNEISLPMYIFIDELDRCRPTYAIELLETVKHLFDIEGIVFVVATDTNQLQHSIKAVYGEGFDSSRYLYRFFERSFSLKKPDVLEFIKTQKIFNQYLSKELISTCDGNLIFTEDSLANSLAAMCESFDFDLRTIQQWLDQLWSCYNNENNKNKYAWFVIAIFLGMKLSDQDLYKEVITKFSGYVFSGRPDKERYRFSFLNRNYSNKNIEIIMSPRHITKTPGDSPNQKFSFSGDKAYNRSYSSSIKLIEFIYNYLSNPPTDTKFAKAVFERDENKNPVIEFAMHYCEHEKGASKQGYIDLVEMASDLS